MSFHETRFPTAISFGSSGGPVRRTDVVVLASGHEERNALWSRSRRRYDAGYGLRSLDDVAAVIAFFEARLGRLHGFRWKDFTDYKSSLPTAPVGPLDQVIGSGTGTQAVFPLRKIYTSGDQSYERLIEKPVAGSVRIAVAGVERVAGTHFTVETATGLVSFLPGHEPAAGLAVTAGFEFDVPVRFDTDELNVSLESFAAGRLPSIPLIEIRL